jgi:hypothetical protein
MNYTAYTDDMGVWNIITVKNFDTWFFEQTGDDQAVILGKVYLLEEYGPHLGRPHADTLKGGKLINLKELRAKTVAHEFRIAYLFDPDQQGVLLVGGDKKGRNQKKFYRDLINRAEQIYAVYLESKTKRKEQ